MTDAVTEPAAPKPRIEGFRRLLPTIVLVLATIVTVIALFANWAERQLLDTDAWTETSTELIANPQVKDAVAQYAVDQLYANVDVAGELGSALPKQLKPLAGPAAGGLRDLAEDLARKALDSPRFEAAWADANRLAHSQFVALVEGKRVAGFQVQGNTVQLDLQPLVVQVADEVGLGDVASKIPADAATIKVLESDEIKTVQDGAKALKGLALLFSLLVPILFGIAIALARGRRRRYVIATGFALIVAGLTVLAARAVLGGSVVDALAEEASVRPAAEAVWSIGTSLLVEGAEGAIWLGVPFILAGLLAGPSRIATSIRRTIAPVLRDQPAIAFGVTAVAWVLLVLWQPSPSLARFWVILLAGALLFLGVAVLRRQTFVEFPDARTSDTTDWLQTHFGKMRSGAQAGAKRASERAASAVASLRGSTASTASSATGPAGGAGPAAASQEDSLAKLERLVALRDAGALTDEEFAEQKRLALGAAAAPSSTGSAAGQTAVDEPSTQPLPTEPATEPLGDAPTEPLADDGSSSEPDDKP